jgi:hypothetical protein
MIVQSESTYGSEEAKIEGRSEEMKSGYRLFERPGRAKCMIAGWTSWVDAGWVSRGIPEYLVSTGNGRKIGELEANRHYVFWPPALGIQTGGLSVECQGGRVVRVRNRRNDFYWVGDGDEGFVVFAGEEPHLDEVGYADTFLAAAGELGVGVVVVVSSVHWDRPYDEEWEVAGLFSLPRMQHTLERHGIRTRRSVGPCRIGNYLVVVAEERELELMLLEVWVPQRDLGWGPVGMRTLAKGQDHRSWYSMLGKLDGMFELGLDMREMKELSDEETEWWEDALEEYGKYAPATEPV